MPTGMSHKISEFNMLTFSQRENLDNSVDTLMLPLGIFLNFNMYYGLISI